MLQPFYVPEWHPFEGRTDIDNKYLKCGNMWFAHLEKPFHPGHFAAERGNFEYMDGGT